jgi:hypothetical protein
MYMQKATLSVVVLFAALATSLPMTASAACRCACVNGASQSICTSGTDLPALCGVELCPLAPTSIPPLPSTSLPPLGTTHCEQAQVYNPSLRQYVWQEVCR